MPHPPDRRRRLTRTQVAAIALVLTGVVLLVLQILNPTQLERAIGQAKVAVEKTVREVVTPGVLPQVTLGPLGGLAELDWCDGRFIELESYRITGVLPVYAAHNNCGGDIMLSFQLGDHIRVEGSDTVYEVVEERHTSKWENIASLRGMAGELVLQTCFWGEPRMRFLSLAPVVS